MLTEWQEFTIEVLGKTVPIAGALTGAWVGFRLAHPRPKLIVWAGIMLGVPLQNPPQKFLVITFTNVGRRPIKVNSIRFRSSLPEMRRKSMIVPNLPGLPIMLEKEGEDKTVHIPFVKDMENISRLTAYDTVGRRWTASRRVIQQIRKDAKD